MAGLEIVDSRIENWRIKLADTIADLASCGAAVLGQAIDPSPELDYRLVGMVFSRNGELVATGAGAAALGDPVAVVAWLANVLGEHGVHAGSGPGDHDRRAARRGSAEPWRYLHGRVRPPGLDHAPRRRKGERGMKAAGRLSASVLGAGLIGIDLTTKIMRSDYLDLRLVAAGTRPLRDCGRRPGSACRSRPRASVPCRSRRPVRRGLRRHQRIRPRRARGEALGPRHHAHRPDAEHGRAHDHPDRQPGGHLRAPRHQHGELRRAGVSTDPARDSQGARDRLHRGGDDGRHLERGPRDAPEPR